MDIRDLLFTFDYELFLGPKSGSVRNCMIDPTKKVLDVLERYGLKSIFFVDSSYLLRLKELSVESDRANSDLELVKKQIIEIIIKGHDVYPHVHPHWLDADYLGESNEWSLADVSKYRFASLSTDIQSNYFKECYSILDEIVKEANPDYKMNAYRAGGWCIQPFSDFKPVFEDVNIKADFSVLGGYHKEANTIQFDFLTISNNARPYAFSEDVTKQDPNGQFIEYPISSVSYPSRSFKNKILNKMLWKLPQGQNMGDGQSAQTEVKVNIKSDDNLEMVSIELLKIYNLGVYKDFIDQNSFMQFISHPKMISQHNLATLEKFCKYASRNYELNSDWRKVK